ncbi:MarR family winged helix-turn-helix transcriptional regulator [Dactylosporangium maewongense]|uniref:MarR family winged helix-turn-helix transcriptional regulator n=1 Tax=Dactylosporangium maewongense TaxID=634393 RepID=UPI0031DFAD40
MFSRTCRTGCRPATAAASRRTSSRTASRLNELGLSRAEAKALLALEPGTPVPVSTVAERIWADRSNTTNLVNRLVTRGLIERRSGPDAGVGDGRTRAITLTGNGQALRERLMTRTAEDNPVFADLTAAERHTLRDLLARIDAYAS